MHGNLGLGHSEWMCGNCFKLSQGTGRVVIYRFTIGLFSPHFGLTEWQHGTHTPQIHTVLMYHRNPTKRNKETEATIATSHVPRQFFFFFGGLLYKTCTWNTFQGKHQNHIGTWNNICVSIQHCDKTTEKLNFFDCSGSPRTSDFHVGDLSLTEGKMIKSNICDFTCSWGFLCSKLLVVVCKNAKEVSTFSAQWNL